MSTFPETAKIDPHLPRVLLFGGTIEGRLIAEWLGKRGTCNLFVSSATEYGATLVGDLPNVISLAGRMPRDKMEQFMREVGFTCVIDATHPYAAEISQSISAVSRVCKVPLCRVLREGEPEGSWEGVADAASAASLVSTMPGRVLLTTGSKELDIYVRAMPDYIERLFVRILPVAASLQLALDGGIPAGHIIAMQGPFSQELNEAIIRQFDIDIMVTKASGASGGFWEKARAAQSCGTKLLVIHRPLVEAGYNLAEAREILAVDYGL